MIRFLVAPVAAALGLAAAAAYLGPDLVTGPRGEPLIMARSMDTMLEPASFYAEDCQPALLFAGKAPSGARIVAFAFRPDPEDVAVAVEDYADQSNRPAETVILLFDKDGDLLAAGDPESLDIGKSGCLQSDSDPAAPV